MRNRPQRSWLAASQLPAAADSRRLPLTSPIAFATILAQLPAHEPLDLHAGLLGHLADGLACRLSRTAAPAAPRSAKKFLSRPSTILAMMFSGLPSLRAASVRISRSLSTSAGSRSSLVTTRGFCGRDVHGHVLGRLGVAAADFDQRAERAVVMGVAAARAVDAHDPADVQHFAHAVEHDRPSARRASGPACRATAA